MTLIPELARRGVKTFAPAMFALTKVVYSEIVPSVYAIAAKRARMDICCVVI